MGTTGFLIGGLFAAIIGALTMGRHQDMVAGGGLFPGYVSGLVVGTLILKRSLVAAEVPSS